MLFTPHSHQRYQLWSAQRCAIILGCSMLSFFIAVIICSLLIQVRPSAVVTLKQTAHGLDLKISKPDSAKKHTLRSIVQLRIIKQDNSVELRDLHLAQQLNTHSADINSQHNIIHLDSLQLSSAQLQAKSAYLLYTPRSLWQFMWERW